MENFTNNELIYELYRRSQSTSADEYSAPEEEIKQLSLKLREAEKGKSDFLSNVRNEINNPLTSILGLAESISLLSKEEKIKRLGSLIHQQAFELDFQMRNIIIASEIEMGNINPMISQVNLTSLLESQIDYLGLKIKSNNVNVSLEVSESLMHPSDSYLLQTIFTNLLANAIEFSGSNKAVNVKAWKDGDQLFVNIVDFGEGIAIEKQRLLFTRFKQLDSSSTKSHAGQGLGLAIVHELVSILEGTFELNSSAQNGTSITIQLPVPQLTQSTSISAYGNEVIFTDGEEF
jgi:signal transduction histidine kinase